MSARDVRSPIWENSQFDPSVWRQDNTSRRPLGADLSTIAGPRARRGEPVEDSGAGSLAVIVPEELETEAVAA